MPRLSHSWGDQMLEFKLFGNHEGKLFSSQLLVLWAINRLLITLADEKQSGKNKLVINEEFIFDQDKY